MLQLKAQMLSVEGNGTVNVIDQIPDSRDVGALSASQTDRFLLG
jgi:hypothetical protein